MHPLVMLYKLQAKALYRRLTRNLKSVKGTFLFIVGVLVVFLRHASGWPAAFAGLFLAMLFVQLFGMAITLIAQAAGERAYTRSRKIVLALILAAIAFALLP